LNSEKIGKFEETQQKRELQFNLVLSVKVDWGIHHMLDQIGLFEHKKPSTLARDILVEKIHVYERNPAFKRFLKQLAEKSEKNGREKT
jgi:hypothetical protein